MKLGYRCGPRLPSSNRVGVVVNGMLVGVVVASTVDVAYCCKMKNSVGVD